MYIKLPQTPLTIRSEWHKYTQKKKMQKHPQNRKKVKKPWEGCAMKNKRANSVNDYEIQWIMILTTCTCSFLATFAQRESFYFISYTNTDFGFNIISIKSMQPLWKAIKSLIPKRDLKQLMVPIFGVWTFH